MLAFYGPSEFSVDDPTNIKACLHTSSSNLMKWCQQFNANSLFQPCASILKCKSPKIIIFSEFYFPIILYKKKINIIYLGLNF